MSYLYAKVVRQNGSITTSNNFLQSIMNEYILGLYRQRKRWRSKKMFKQAIHSGQNHHNIYKENSSLVPRPFPHFQCATLKKREWSGDNIEKAEKAWGQVQVDNLRISNEILYHMARVLN